MVGYFLQCISLIGGFYFDSLTLLFLFDLFLEARAEILTNILLVSKRKIDFGSFSTYSLYYEYFWSKIQFEKELHIQVSFITITYM
jgi:hypothetical protein